MTLYISNRDGDGKTSEEGHYRFQTSIWRGDILGADSLKVTENTSLGRNVLISPGQFKIDTGYGYAYTGWSSAAHTLAISTADGANPRITSVVAYVDRSQGTSPSPPNNPNIAKFMAINGTPSAIPLAPSAGVIQAAIGASNPYIILAEIRVPASSSQVLNSQITDLRRFVELVEGTVGTDALKSNSVTTDKLNSLAVTTDKLGPSSVTGTKLANAAVDDTKWRNGVTFSARRTATRTFAASTWTKISPNLVDFNIGNAYTNTSDVGRFTAPVSGIYSFYISMNAEVVNQTRAILSLYKNGSDYTRMVDTAATAVRVLNGSTILALDAGDYVEAWGWITTTANISHASRTAFGGSLITRI